MERLVNALGVLSPDAGFSLSRTDAFTWYLLVSIKWKNP